jgi:hypothetical protein
MKKYLGFFTMFVLSLMIFTMFNPAKQVKESFTYFPTNHDVLFQTAETTLTFMNDNNKGYELLWRTGSILDRKAYLRQDISLLFENGRLVSLMGKDWKQNEDKISLESSVIQNESANYQAISFHHAEIHDHEQITSSQKHSHDGLYVLNSKFHPLHSFRLPVHQQDEEWKKLIDEYIDNKLNLSLKAAQKQYSLDLNQYTIFPVTTIYHYEDHPLPGFTESETKEIVGRLWEGLYKNYFLGVKKKDGTSTDPIHSTIPIILVAKDQTHLMVISKLSDGEIMLLKQRIVQIPDS